MIKYGKRMHAKLSTTADRVKGIKVKSKKEQSKPVVGVEGNVWKSLAKMTSKLYIENSGLWVTRKGGQTSLSTIPSASQSNAALVVARSSTLTIIFCQRVTAEL